MHCTALQKKKKRKVNTNTHNRRIEWRIDSECQSLRPMRPLGIWFPSTTPSHARHRVVRHARPRIHAHHGAARDVLRGEIEGGHIEAHLGCSGNHCPATPGGDAERPHLPLRHAVQAGYVLHVCRWSGGEARKRHTPPTV